MIPTIVAHYILLLSFFWFCKTSQASDLNETSSLSILRRSTLPNLGLSEPRIDLVKKANTKRHNAPHGKRTPTTTYKRHRGRALTNAQRLARGLPVNSPRFRQRDTAARRSLPSSLPSVSVRGYIQCNHRNSTAIGYVPYLYGSSGSNSVNGLYGYNNGRPWPQSTYDASNPPVEVEIIYDTTAPASVMREDLDIKTPNGGFRSVEEGFSNWYFMGGIGGTINDRDDLGPDLGTYGHIGGTGQTPAGALPTEGENFAWYNFWPNPSTVESPIWTFVPATKKLGIKWVNTDGSKVDVEMFTQDSIPIISFAGNLQKVADIFQEPSRPIDCYFVDKLNMPITT